MRRSSSARCADASAGMSRKPSATRHRRRRQRRAHRGGASHHTMVSFTSTMPSSDWKTLERLAARLDVHHLRRDVVLAPYTTFRIGGPADLFFEATSADALASAVLAARELRVAYFVLGLGANVLIGDRGVRGLVIRNTAAAREFRDRDGTCDLWSESGAVMKDLIQESVARGWSGLEHYVGIPSTVGGAIWQNLHFLSPAPDRERTMFIAEVFASCEILSEESERKT